MIVNHELHKLKNGLQVLLIPSKTTYSATIFADIHSGSALESKNQSGITHFIEHMSLKSTEKWPTKKAISEATEFIGAFSNGATGIETLKYLITVPYNQFDFGIDFIHQVLYHSTFSPDHVDQERTIILDELANYEDDVGYNNSIYISKLLSKNKSSYIQEIGGTKKTVSKFSRDQLYKHSKVVHDPSRVLITVVGNFNKTRALKTITSLFSNITSTEKNAEFPIDEVDQSIIKSKKNDKTDLIIATLMQKAKGRKQTTKRESILNGLSLNILAGPMTSRLIKRLREDEGLLYSVGAGSSTFENMGSTMIYFDTSVDIFKKSYELILEEIDLYINKGISTKELNHFQQFLINRNLVTFDNIHSYSKLIRLPTFYNKKIKTIEELNEIIKSITVKEMNTHIKKQFELSTINSLAYGNIKSDTQSYMKKTLSKYK